MSKPKPAAVQACDWRVAYHVTTMAEFKALIRSANVVRVNVGTDARIVGVAETYYPNFWYASVEVTKVQALRFAEQTIGERAVSKNGEDVYLFAYTTTSHENYRRCRRTGELLPPRDIMTLWIG